MILQDTINAYYKHNQNQRETAESLGIARSTLQERLKKAQELGIKPKIRIQAVSKVEEKIRLGLKERPLSIVYFTDAHNQPSLNKDRFKWLAHLVNDIEPDILIDGGDFDDFHSLCTHEKNDTFKGRFKPSLQADLESSNEAHQVLDDNLKVPCRKVRTAGNHEHRLFSFEDRNPEMYGFLQHAYLDITRRFGWEFCPYGEYVDIAGVDFTHSPLNRMGKATGGKRLCVNLARDSVRDIVCGHTHEKNIHTETKYGPSRSVTALNAGCFMPEGYIPDYAKNTQVNYWRGCFHLQIESAKVRIIREYTLEDLKAAYG